jgi:hypothetical protein
MLAKSRWMLGQIPAWVLRTGAVAAMPTVRANEERGWTMRGREPYWTRSVADSSSWAGQWRATTTTRSPPPAQRTRWTAPAAGSPRTSQALSEQLRDRWGALERAEARLAAGTYGTSVLSGRPIPDERLAAFPLAELTVEEAADRDRSLSGSREPESRMGPSRDPFRVFEDPAAQDDGLVEDEGSDDEPDPEANLGVRTTPET